MWLQTSYWSSVNGNRPLNANNCELCNKDISIIGYNRNSGAIRLSANSAVGTNIELNTFITWNQVSRLANLKPNLLLHIGGENSAEVRSRFLHWYYLSRRSSTTHQPAASKLCPICRRLAWQNDITKQFGCQHLMAISSPLSCVLKIEVTGN